MVGPRNYLAYFLTTLFSMRLATVRFPTFSSVAFHRSDHPTGRILKVRAAIGESRVHLTLPTVIACMMFLWDYILTFEMEVDLIWKSNWNFMKGLYLFQCYFLFTDTILLALVRQSDVFPYLLSMLSFFSLIQVWEEIQCRNLYYASGGS